MILRYAMYICLVAVMPSVVYAFGDPKSPSYNEEMDNALRSYLAPMGICCEVNDTNEQSETGVMVLLEKGAEKEIRYLVNNGYDKSLKNKRGETAYDIAVRSDYKGELLELLRPKGYVGLYDLTTDENNIVNKPEKEAIELLLSRASKQNFGDVGTKRILRNDINGDGKLDLLIIYDIPEPAGGGNRSWSGHIAAFVQTALGRYSLFGEHMLDNIGMDFDSVRNYKNGIELTSFFYQKDDAQCCPSGKKKVIVEFTANGITIK